MSAGRALKFSAASVRVGAVSVQYREHRVLDELTLEIEAGQLLALLGPSGCGKTTLLRVVAGLQAPAHGSVYIGDRRVDDVPPFRRGVGMVFQNYALFPHMTVKQNVEFGLKMQGVRKVERTPRIAELLRMLQVERLISAYPSQLSGGQQQRVALARTLAVKPAVLLLDEPLAALDRRLRDTMRIELRRLLKEVGITTIIVTHDQEEALSIADRVAIINRGQIEQVGSPHEIYKSPRTRFVADFVGQMNYLDGEVVDLDGAELVVRIGCGIDIRARGSKQRVAGDRVQVAIRPEIIEIDDLEEDERSGPANRVKARLVQESFVGTVSHMTFELSDGPALTVTQTSGQRDRLAGRTVGNTDFRLTWPVDGTTVFE